MLTLIHTKDMPVLELKITNNFCYRILFDNASFTNKLIFFFTLINR